MVYLKQTCGVLKLVISFIIMIFKIFIDIIAIIYFTQIYVC